MIFLLGWLSEKLSKTQFDLDSDPTSVSLQKLEKESRISFVEMSRAEESFLRQKSRIQWLNLGDQSTGFFFKFVANF